MHVIQRVPITGDAVKQSCFKGSVEEDCRLFLYKWCIPSNTEMKKDTNLILIEDIPSNEKECDVFLYKVS